jgi:predicted metal-dependent hydrolase
VPDRDRDESGKARNLRPRDALGRPLPHGSAGVSRVPDDLTLSAVDSLAYAQQLLDRGLAFNAHEVLEAAWKIAPDTERAMWQALAQVAVGITHIQRGNSAGAESVLRRAADGLMRSREVTLHGVDVDGLVAYAEGLITDLAQHADISVPRLRPRLQFSRP